MTATPVGWRVWWMAIRPMSLFASVAPILVGSAVAIREGGFAPLTAAVALLVAMLLQILSNLANDLFDFRRGADRARVGPARVVQSGLVSERRMEVAIGLVVLLALLGGLHLVWRGGWPILLLGLLALLCAVAYTGGPFPLGYHGLGDLFVFIFFGLVGVAGSAYVQTRDLTLLAVLCALPIACLATAIIVPNNLRDIETDRAAGKRTLAVRIGPRATVSEYLALLAAAYLIPPVLCLTGQIGLGWLLTLVSAPLALALATHIRSATGRELVPVLIGTSRLTGLFGLLFAIGIAL